MTTLHGIWRESFVFRAKMTNAMSPSTMKGGDRNGTCRLLTRTTVCASIHLNETGERLRYLVGEQQSKNRQQGELTPEEL